MYDRVSVILLPCGAGFSHPLLIKRLHDVELRNVYNLEDIDTKNMIRSIDEVAKREYKRGQTVILHGWSMGGGIVLEYLNMYDGDPPYIDFVLLFAAAGSASLKSSIPVVLYHNVHDSVIRLRTSERNKNVLGTWAVLKTSDLQDGGNNHQCNEFVEDAVDIIRQSADSIIEQQGIFILDDTFSKQVYDYFVDLNIRRYKFLNFTSERDANMLMMKLVMTTDDVSYRCEPNCPSWEEIKCKENFPTKTDCVDHNNRPFTDRLRSWKIFVYGCKNLYEYIRDLQSGHMRPDEHKYIWDQILNRLRMDETITVLNHNKDVNTLHFKFERI